MEKRDIEDLDTIFQGHQGQYVEVVVKALSDGYKGHGELVELLSDLDAPETSSTPWELKLVLNKLDQAGIISTWREDLPGNPKRTELKFQLRGL